MAKPPVSPLSIDGKETSYFQVLAKWAGEHLEKDGIKLNFQGYTETLKEYANLNEEQTDIAWRLAKELNTWAEYFSGVANLIQKLYLDSEAEKEETKSSASFAADDKKVANGDRLSNKDPGVVNARKKRNTLKAFYEELESKVKFFERAHYHCKATYDAKTKHLQPSYSQNPHSNAS